MTGIILICVILIGLAGAARAAYARFYGPEAMARRRLETGQVRHFAEGEVVTLVGTVQAIGEPLEAPLSRVPCVAYAVHVDLHDVPAEGARTRNIVETIRLERFVPFRLLTPDGPVDITTTVVDSSIPLAPLVPHDRRREQAFLRDQGKSANLALAGPFTEYAIEPGSKLRVQGMAVLDAPDPSVEADYRTAVPARARLVPHANHPLTIGRP